MLGVSESVNRTGGVLLLCVIWRVYTCFKHSYIVVYQSILTAGKDENRLTDHLCNPTQNKRFKKKIQGARVGPTM